jgi:hypothetical protein
MNAEATKLDYDERSDKSTVKEPLKISHDCCDEAAKLPGYDDWHKVQVCILRTYRKLNFLFLAI